MEQLKQRLEAILPHVTKPARYTGHEWNSVVKDWDATPVRFVLAYPDIYEVGMSNLALQILYDLLNRQGGVLCERTFAPWPDMEKAMREADVPLYGLESHHPLADYDIIGFTLPYELNYTTALNMLDLAGLPLRAADRDARYPLVIGGGSCAYNPEPLAPFFDLFVLGEGEEVAVELVAAYAARFAQRAGRAARTTADPAAARQDLLRQLAAIDGVYVPAFYDVTYHDDGTVAAVTPREAEARPIIVRRVVDPLPPPPTRPIVPFVEAIHDRGAIEIMRGCARGCRFCQAGAIYRPVRERSPEEVLAAIDELIANTGYNEVALLSLSSTDYTHIEQLVGHLAARYGPRALTVSLPSLRVDAFSVSLARLLARTPAGGERRTGLTFAPEAGTQRLRDAINKSVSNEQIVRTATAVFDAGWTGIKLYFMVGLPTETRDDVQGIVDLVRQIYRLGRERHGNRARVNVSVATFVPKPHSACQWHPLDDEASLKEKHRLLRRGLRRGNIHLSWHDPDISLLEATLARGDRRMAAAVEEAWRRGSRLDAWSEMFDLARWREAFAATGLEMDFYARRARPVDEVTPWDHLSAGISRAFLVDEAERLTTGEATSDCHTGPCHSCGACARTANSEVTSSEEGS